MCSARRGRPDRSIGPTRSPGRRWKDWSPNISAPGIDYSANDCTLSYWRIKSGNEVDFVVYGRAGFWAIEVKNGRRVHLGDRSVTFSRPFIERAGRIGWHPAPRLW